jgi:transmembrane sensor
MTIPDPIADEAGYWDARLRSPSCNDSDRARFAEWRDADPRHRAAFERLQTLCLALRQNRSRADVRALRDAALSAQERPSRRPVVLVAAMLAMVAVGMTLWANFSGGTRGESVAGLAEVGVYETATGQRSTSTLQDGSVVDLNARTRIKVSFTDQARTVELIYGQAMFHIAHNAQRPFTVRAGDREITAIGTQFDVRLDAESVSVTLIEGKVQVLEDTPTASGVRRSGTPQSGDRRGSGMPLYLTPGQQYVARLSDAEAPTDELVRTVDVSKVTGWHEGHVFLDDLSLTDAVAEMNRHSPVQITVSDPRLARLRVNGMFRAGEQEAFVSALEQYFPIAAHTQGDTEIILSSRR